MAVKRVTFERCERGGWVKCEVLAVALEVDRDDGDMLRVDLERGVTEFHSPVRRVRVDPVDEQGRVLLWQV